MQDNIARNLAITTSLMLILYTGNGKGKTSACVGQALRAMGRGMTVAFGQFMKRDNQSGEQRILKQLLGTFFFAGGEGFFRHEKDRARHRAAALNTLAWGENILPGADMLVLDETLYALGAALLTEREVANLAVDRQLSHLIGLHSNRFAVGSRAGAVALVEFTGDLIGRVISSSQTQTQRNTHTN